MRDDSGDFTYRELDRMSDYIAQKLTENGFRVINNCGKDAKQSVPHLHYHILAGGDMGERIV